MTSQLFAIVCLLGFLVPVPLLSWLDRVPEKKSPAPKDADADAKGKK